MIGEPPLEHLRRVRDGPRPESVVEPVAASSTPSATDRSPPGRAHVPLVRWHWISIAAILSGLAALWGAGLPQA